MATIKVNHMSFIFNQRPFKENVVKLLSHSSGLAVYFGTEDIDEIIASASAAPIMAAPAAPASSEPIKTKVPGKKEEEEEEEEEPTGIGSLF